MVACLPDVLSGTLPPGGLTQAQGESVLSLALLGKDTKTPGPSMLGRYEHTGCIVSFTPRIPLAHGGSYRAFLRVGGGETFLDYSPPAPEQKAPPRVVNIYPSASVLPANHLRFYICFDRSMRGGREVFKHLSLVDDAGREINAPWLEDEIWDDKSNCLILYIHPGRIKRGVDLRESAGPVLRENQDYSLMVRGEWTDLEGNKLGCDTIKKFRTAGEELGRVDLGDWKVNAPAVDTCDALTLVLGKTLDYRGVLSGLTVRGPGGQPVDGRISVGTDEKTWSFTPFRPWLAVGYWIDVSPDLEDVAGNTPLRPFDRDLLSPKAMEQSLQIYFKPR
ncbi:MAG: hypothetical protein EBR81_17115 [Proteobacteria bacterium]|nr:hypothetical protein [Pseudomonadota bacterium]